jgi:hypothetical protein
MSKLSRFIYWLVLPFILQHPVYESHRDEFLYLAEGRHLAFGYRKVPPLLSVFAWLARLFGAGLFWIKIWPALFGALNFLHRQCQLSLLAARRSTPG